jgi:hypothetical protein
MSTSKPSSEKMRAVSARFDAHARSLGIDPVKERIEQARKGALEAMRAAIRTPHERPMVTLNRLLEAAHSLVAAEAEAGKAAVR